jgi:hypothetical protein
MNERNEFQRYFTQRQQIVVATEKLVKPFSLQNAPMLIRAGNGLKMSLRAEMKLFKL